VLGLVDHLAVRPPGVTLVEEASLVLLDASVGSTSARRGPPSLAGSRWAVEVRGHRDGTLPALDLPGHRRLVEFVTAIVAEGVGGSPTGEAGGGGPALVSGIHDVSGGGLGVALTEMAVRSGVGLLVAGVSDHHELFTEAPSRVVVCTTRRAELVARAAEAGVGFRVLGRTGGDRVVVEGLVDLGLAEVTASWRDRLPSLLDELAPVTN
jgi:phosphoribosylformylglycinamidine synthase